MTYRRTGNNRERFIRADDKSIVVKHISLEIVLVINYMQIVRHSTHPLQSVDM